MGFKKKLFKMFWLLKVIDIFRQLKLTDIIQVSHQATENLRNYPPYVNIYISNKVKNHNILMEL